MTRQFIIVNNGMTEIRGHYFETAISIAEAARHAGFRPFLAVHETCPVDGFPAWLNCLPHFRVDHWGGNAKFHAMRRDGIRGDRAAMLDAPFASVSLREYLAARYDPLPAPPPFTQRLKALVKRCMPARMIQSLKRIAGVKPEVEVPPENPERHHELECARLFEEDLEFLLCLLDVGPDDFVFSPTANHREVLAVRRLIAKIGESRVPKFDLEFRHEIAERGDLTKEARPEILRETRLGQFFFDECKDLPPTERLRLWTDTEELADDYRHLSGLPFGVLPIPFNHGLIENQMASGSTPLRCLYLGDVREEKGFHLLPELIRESGDAVHFVIQATKLPPNGITPAIATALQELATFDNSNVELIGREMSFLPRERYFQLLAQADVVLCLYDAKIYRARSSGIMTEALAAGKPVVVPAGTWMSRQLPSGCGETFTDLPSLAAAVRKLAIDYPQYHANVQRQRSPWLANHSPSALLKCLTQETPCQKQAA